MHKNKKAQEEMIGFALIIVIVAVILLIFLGFSLSNNSRDNVESYEIESFIQAVLQYTTDCNDNLEYVSVQDLIFDCNNQETCSDGRSSCEVLNITLTDLLKQSWKTGENSPVKGYELKINSNQNSLLNIIQGNSTKNAKVATQDFNRRGNLIEIVFEAYY